MWLDGAEIENLLGSNLTTSHVTLLPNQTVDGLADITMSQQGRFVAVVEPDKTFHCRVDRLAALERMASEVVKQARSRES